MPKYLSIKGALPLSLILYIALTGLLIGRVPLGLAPDEAAHWDYIAYMADNGRPPVFKITKAPDYGYEFHQPPLYYAINAPFWKAFHGNDTAKYLARIISLICGALCIYFLWNSLKVLLPNKPQITILSTLFLGLLPMHQAVGASGGNDALAGMFCALLLWIITRGKTDWDWKKSLSLGIIAGLAILTKSSILLPIIAAFGAIIHVMWRVHKRTFAHIATQIGIAILAFAIVGGWWLTRNQLLYGDPLAMNVFQKAFVQSSPGPFVFFAAGISVLTYFRALISILFCTFWGLFGGPNTALQVLNPFGTSGAKPIALWASPLALIFLCVMVFSIWGVWKSLRGGFDKSTFTHIILAWWMIEFALVVLSWAQFNIHYFQAQSRYFHPAILPIAAGLCYGWAKLWGDENSKLSAASLVVALSMIAVTLWNILGWRSLV